MNFAIYRLPHNEGATTLVRQSAGQPSLLRGITELSGQSGFCMAPFVADADTPIIIIRPDAVDSFQVYDDDSCRLLADTLRLPDVEAGEPLSVQKRAGNRRKYNIDFANFYAQLQQHRFEKLVLARSAFEPAPRRVNPVALFVEACRRYPRLFVALVGTEQTGLWLVATPEVLIEHTDSFWHTIALAGTMFGGSSPRAIADDRVPSISQWSGKDLTEQQIVSTYVAKCVQRYAGDLRIEGPRSVRAANLFHLRTDFTFTLNDSAQIGQLLSDLHPTPAVCGLPKREARDFIMANEHEPRGYYSGFLGPIALGQKQSTHLYVTLRCMNILHSGYRLYAGGGLLPQSSVESEWQETENKMATMRNLL